MGAKMFPKGIKNNIEEAFISLIKERFSVCS